MLEDKQIEWIINQHKNTNHLYDNYLPYEFHLRMVVANGEKYNRLNERLWSDIILACWGHDLIEDTRVSYNDVKEVLGYEVSEIIYAVSNEKGKNRSERANEKYYEGIKNTPGAEFVKLCDRIANVQYSKMTGSRMFQMYKKENGNFMAKIDFSGSRYNEMYRDLMDLLK